MHDLYVAASSFGAALLVGAALHDVAARTVPNRLAACAAAAGLVAQAAGGDLLLAVPVAFLVFFVAALAWRRGYMGGGDVKLLGASALLVPTVAVPSMIVVTALAGGVLAIIYLVARHRMPFRGPARPMGLFGRAMRAECWRMRRGGPMPYAVAIACGVLFVLSSGAMP